jgi:hypothetical protein
MNPSDTPTFDFQQAVATQFGDRPTLREVASEHLLKTLLAKLPWLARVHPALSSADPLLLDSPDPATPYWTTQPLVDRLLQGLLDSTPLDLEPLGERHHNLGLSEPYRFPGSHHPLDTRQLKGLSDALNELLAQLPQYFCEAQLAYWNAKGSAGVSRDQWLQLLLKTALLRALPFQGLDVQEQACVRGLIRGGHDQPAAFFVRASMVSDGREYDEMQAHVLLLAELDERQLVLYCAPSGEVRAFASLALFGQALRDDLAQRYRFESMTWQRHPVEGNVFAQQVALLLDALCHRVERARCLGLADVGALEQRYAQLSDVSPWFVRYENETPAVRPPPGLLATAAQNSFACSSALLSLALNQLDSQGKGALDGIQTLTDFAREQVSAQMRSDHAEDSSPDDLLLDLYLARGVPGGAATGAGGGEPLVFVGSKSLTAFAIGNLASLKGASIENIRRSDGRAAPSWLTADAARTLVSKTDIGGRYPAYVAARLDDPGERSVRVEQLGREWRSALLSGAVTARLDGKVSEAGLQCVVDFCAGHVDLSTPRMALLPLAFRRSSSSQVEDRVRGMYLLYCAEPALVLLYRPLYRRDTVREYANLGALLEHVRESALLQDSILTWLAPQARDTYAHGGFREPHIVHVGIDPYVALQRPQPATLGLRFWRNQLDERFYQANRDLLVELADRQSLSNAENRWSTLLEGAGLLFDVATLALRGPIASVAWLAQLLVALQYDIDALEQGSGFDRSAAVVDLMLNISMTLLHAHQPKLATAPGAWPDASAFEGPAPQRGAFAESAVVPLEKPLAPAQMPLPALQLDFSWRGQQGFNWLPKHQRQALQAMRSAVSLDAVKPMTIEGHEELYLLDNHHYVRLAGETYRVAVSAVGVRVIDPNGGHGPWLAFVEGAWRLDPALRLAGGMRGAAGRERLASRFRSLRDTVTELDNQVVAGAARFKELGNSVLAKETELQKLKTLKASLEEKQGTEGAPDAQALIGMYGERIAQRQAEVTRLRDDSIQELEGMVRAGRQMLPALTTLQEPKYANARRAAGLEGVIASHRANVLIDQIRHNDLIFHELWQLTDYPRLARLQKSLDGLPLVEASALYRQFRQRLEVVVAYQERMLLAQEQLDELLSDTPDDQLISTAPPEPPRTVGQLKAARPFSTVQLRFHQVLNLADLALHLDDATGQKRLARYRDDLAGMSLRNAAQVHGELDFANLSAADRIVILQEAWDEYSAALLNSGRVREEGGTLIEPAMLDRYREHVGKLKLDAGARLVQAIREQDGGGTSVRGSPYVVADVPQQMVRNAEGQLLIGTPVTEGGEALLEVRESVSGELLATFEQVGGDWQQRGEKLPSLIDEAPSADLPLWVQSLLEDSAGVREKARSYVENDIKGNLLARLFDRQLEKLERAVGIVRDANGNDALLRTLEREAGTLRSERKLRLTMLYTNTRYPTAEALRFLHADGLIEVQYGERRTMQDGSAFDEYRVLLLLPTKRKIWAAHFHFNSPDDFPQDFVSGHLKTWSQRRMSSRQAAEAGQRLHRGRLTLEQARGIIPFHGSRR